MSSSLKLDLNTLAGIIHPFLLSCYHDYLDGKIYSYDLVGIFILSFISMKKPKNWCNGKLKTIINDKNNYNSSNLSNYPQLISWLHMDYLVKNLKSSCVDIISSFRIVDIFCQLKFKGFKDNNDNYVNKLIVEWALNKVPFELLFYIPNSIQVLEQQSLGKRVITMFYTLSDLAQKHHSNLTYMSGMQSHSRDALEFVLHDMKHMEHFHHPAIYEEQVGFFQCLYQLHNNNIKEYFISVCELDEQFWLELEYVISDMNCFATHLLRYLYAKVFDAMRRKIILASNNTAIKNVVEEVDNQDVLRKAMIDMWGKILQAMGMISVNHNNNNTSVGRKDVTMIFTCNDIDNNEGVEQCSYNAYHISMDLISVTFKERVEWSESEGNIIRQFFQYKSSNTLIT